MRQGLYNDVEIIVLFDVVHSYEACLLVSNGTSPSPREESLANSHQSQLEWFTQ